MLLLTFACANLAPFRTTIPLLHALVTSAQILNATKLREFVKTELVDIHTKVRRHRAEHAALLSLCIAQTLMMEASYSTSLTSFEPLKGVWSLALRSTVSRVLE